MIAQNALDNLFAGQNTVARVRSCVLEWKN